MISKRPICWTIAGSDSSGGAGIQADIAAIRAFGAYPCSVITAITAQNSLTVSHIEATSLTMFKAQLSALLEDLPPQAIKVGMLPTVEQITHFARFYQQSLQPTPLIIDPVAISASGSRLTEHHALQAMLQHLLPLATLVTPNIAELELLCGHPIDSDTSLLEGARFLIQQGANAVLVKGGHAHWQGEQACDYFISQDLAFCLQQPRVCTAHTHGTGCSMASAIAAAMALGDPIEDAIVQANAYIAAGLVKAQAVGSGPGPVAHTQLPTPARYFPSLHTLWPLISDTPSIAQKAFAPVETQQLGLYPVVDNVERLRSLLELGVTTLQLRIKHQADVDIEAAVLQATQLGNQYQARVFINDHWALALKYRAYGVHLGQEDLQQADLAALQQAGVRLGVSTHGYFELLNALRLRPSYIALGHVFPTPTKVMKSRPQGLKRLRHYVQISANVPTVAIGGINLDNATEVANCGVGSLAVVRAVGDCESDQLATTVEAFNRVI